MTSMLFASLISINVVICLPLCVCGVEGEMMSGLNISSVLIDSHCLSKHVYEQARALMGQRVIGQAMNQTGNHVTTQVRWRACRALQT